MEWLDNLYGRFMAGENPETLYAEYRVHAELDEAEARHTPIPRETAKLMAAWDNQDWEALEPWLTRDGTAITAEGTRILVDGWGIAEAQSR